MVDYISSDFSIEEENSLTHHGVKGMKWGRRKQKPTSGKKKKSNVKSKIQKKLANVDKEKVKRVAKTAAIIAGGVALSAAMPHIASFTTNAVSSYINESNHARELARWHTHRQLVGLEGYTYIGKDTYVKGYSSLRNLR